MVGEANALSEEMDKKVQFELALISPQARGQKEGKTEVSGVRRCGKDIAPYEFHGT